MDRLQSSNFQFQASLILNLEIGLLESSHILNSKEGKDAIFRDKKLYSYLIHYIYKL